MDFAAQMRVGSLEMLAAIAAATLVIAKLRLPTLRDLAPLRLALEINEQGALRRIEAATPLVVGRSSQADVTLSDPEVSRTHARFESSDGVVYLNDLRSRNGTFLNGRRIDDAIEVRPGDHIDVGNARMTLVRQESWT
ncbi:MAG: FHA domain-containing protein [Candidatus Eremiobacteraeota bacterium]|nr:FHA domain-containing protein [Candidatus Eremiobacteraeota bacterium]